MNHLSTMASACVHFAHRRPQEPCGAGCEDELALLQLDRRIGRQRREQTQPFLEIDRGTGGLRNGMLSIRKRGL